MENLDYGYYNDDFTIQLDDEPTCINCGIYCPGDTHDICMIQAQHDEYLDMMYHQRKNAGYWALVKTIVQQTISTPGNDIFLIDILEDYLDAKNINFYLIEEVEYRYAGETYLIPKYESQFLLENVKINSSNEPSFDFDKNNMTGTYRLTIY